MQDTKITYLTNALLESTDHASAEQFDKLGLNYGTFEGDFYPLTKDEEKYLWDTIDAGGHILLAGYSVLYRNRKWFAPTLQVFYSEGEGPYPSRDEALDEIRAIDHHLYFRIKEVGGRLHLEEDADLGDRHILMLMLPMDYIVRRFPNPDDYRDWLAAGFSSSGE